MRIGKERKKHAEIDLHEKIKKGCKDRESEKCQVRLLV
jgi:hypothetical protein